MNVNDALQFSAFLTCALEVMNKNSRTPADETRLQPIRRIALEVERSMLLQVDSDTLDAVIAENNTIYH